MSGHKRRFRKPEHTREEEGEPLLIYTAQGSPFRRKKLIKWYTREIRE